MLTFEAVDISYPENFPFDLFFSFITNRGGYLQIFLLYLIYTERENKDIDVVPGNTTTSQLNKSGNRHYQLNCVFTMQLCYSLQHYIKTVTKNGSVWSESNFYSQFQKPLHRFTKLSFVLVFRSPVLTFKTIYFTSTLVTWQLFSVQILLLIYITSHVTMHSWKNTPSWIDSEKKRHWRFSQKNSLFTFDKPFTGKESFSFEPFSISCTSPRIASFFSCNLFKISMVASGNGELAETRVW